MEHRIDANRIRLLAWVVLLSQIVIVPVSAQTPAPDNPSSPKDNEEMREIFREDQRDRGDDPFDQEAAKSLKRVPWGEVAARDSKRLQRVRVLLDAGRIATAEDQVYAAFIFQHGKSVDDFALTHVLASTAASKGQPAPRWARWLAVAALDRLLLNSGQAQIFGTQVKAQKTPDGMRRTLEPYNRAAVTDAIRRDWCVIPLEEQDRMIRDANQGKALGPSNIRDCR